MVDVCIATACATGGTVFGGRLGDAEACTDTRQQFGYFEGLGHVVVGTGFKALQRVDVLDACGEKQDRAGEMLA